MLAVVLSFLLLGDVDAREHACLQQEFRFSGPAQRLEQTLDQVSRQSGCPVVFDARRFPDRQAPELDGVYTPAGALLLLIRGSGLEVRHVAGRLIVDRQAQDRLLGRMSALVVRIDRAYLARTLRLAEANALYGQLADVQRRLLGTVRRQGFVSAAELDSYERTLRRLEAQVGRKS